MRVRIKSIIFVKNKKNNRIMNHYGTMNMGYYYASAKGLGYDVSVGRLIFDRVAYHSTGQLIDQLVKDGYKKEDIVISKN